MAELVKFDKEENISITWGKVFLHLLKKDEISPLIISVEGFDNNLKVAENEEIRNSLDDSLDKIEESSVRTVANTIFPRSLWNPKMLREELYERHNKILPSIETCDANKRGHYFRRMIAYSNGSKTVNQLEKVFDLWDRNKRHSGMQIAFFDPLKDHIPNPMLGFPCLHQISIDCYGSNGKDGMGLTAFYGTQHIHRKAYGNYLGLCRLGMFMAEEMGLQFVRLNCVAGKAKFASGFRKTSDNTKELKRVITNNIKLI